MTETPDLPTPGGEGGGKEIARLRELVRLADNLYVAARQKAQKESDKVYMDEFGTKGPSLAGFLPGGADREYHYARHTAGECPDPLHARYMREEADES